MIASSFVTLQLLSCIRDLVVVPVGRSHPERLVYSPMEYGLNQESIYAAVSPIVMIQKARNQGVVAGLAFPVIIRPNNVLKRTFASHPDNFGLCWFRYVCCSLDYQKD